MRSFITGSRAYGTPTAKSDVDLVILVTQADLELLRSMCDSDDKDREKDVPSDGGPTVHGPAGSASLRFGRMNLIVVSDPVAFEIWREGTRALKRLRDDGQELDRDAVIQYFGALRRARGLYDRTPRPADFKPQVRGKSRWDDGEDIPF
jgi:predicted nucleotidyltransferase